MILCEFLSLIEIFVSRFANSFVTEVMDQANLLGAVSGRKTIQVGKQSLHVNLERTGNKSLCLIFLEQITRGNLLGSTVNLFSSMYCW